MSRYYSERSPPANCGNLKDLDPVSTHLNPTFSSKNKHLSNESVQRNMKTASKMQTLKIKQPTIKIAQKSPRNFKNKIPLGSVSKDSTSNYNNHGLPVKAKTIKSGRISKKPVKYKLYTVADFPKHDKRIGSDLRELLSESLDIFAKRIVFANSVTLENQSVDKKVFSRSNHDFGLAPKFVPVPSPLELDNYLRELLKGVSLGKKYIPSNSKYYEIQNKALQLCDSNDHFRCLASLFLMEGTREENAKTMYFPKISQYITFRVGQNAFTPDAETLIDVCCSRLIAQIFRQCNIGGRKVSELTLTLCENQLRSIGLYFSNAILDKYNQHESKFLISAPNCVRKLIYYYKYALNYPADNSFVQMVTDLNDPEHRVRFSFPNVPMHVLTFFRKRYMAYIHILASILVKKGDKNKFERPFTVETCLSLIRDCPKLLPFKNIFLFSNDLAGSSKIKCSMEQKQIFCNENTGEYTSSNSFKLENSDNKKKTKKKQTKTRNIIKDAYESAEGGHEKQDDMIEVCKAQETVDTMCAEKNICVKENPSSTYTQENICFQEKPDSLYVQERISDVQIIQPTVVNDLNNVSNLSSNYCLLQQNNSVIQANFPNSVLQNSITYQLIADNQTTYEIENNIPYHTNPQSRIICQNEQSQLPNMPVIDFEQIVQTEFANAEVLVEGNSFDEYISNYNKSLTESVQPIDFVPIPMETALNVENFSSTSIQTNSIENTAMSWKQSTLDNIVMNYTNTPYFYLLFFY